MAGTFLRLRGARMIGLTHLIQVLKKIRKQREDLAKLRNFDASIRRGCFFAREPAKRVADLELTSDISESEKFADMNKDANAALLRTRQRKWYLIHRRKRIRFKAKTEKEKNINKKDLMINKINLKKEFNPPQKKKRRDIIYIRQKYIFRI